MQERGLKHRHRPCVGYVFWVAPRAGAWIETPTKRSGSRRRIVAPRAGAWIETHWSGGTTQPSHVAPRADILLLKVFQILDVIP